jgi:hypothetical protein
MRKKGERLRKRVHRGKKGEKREEMKKAPPKE